MSLLDGMASGFKPRVTPWSGVYFHINKCRGTRLLNDRCLCAHDDWYVISWGVNSNSPKCVEVRGPSAWFKDVTLLLMTSPDDHSLKKLRYLAGSGPQPACGCSKEGSPGALDARVSRRDVALSSRPIRVMSTCWTRCRCPILLQTLEHWCQKTSLDLGMSQALEKKNEKDGRIFDTK